MLHKLLPPLLSLLLLLSSSRGSSQTTSPPTQGQVCFPVPVAQRLLDSLRHLPTVRREAQEWQRAYANARFAADTNAYAAKEYHRALLRSQVAFSGQQLLLGEQRAETEKFKVRAHRKGWALTALLAGIGLLVYLR